MQLIVSPADELCHGWVVVAAEASSGGRCCRCSEKIPFCEIVVDMF